MEFVVTENIIERKSVTEEMAGKRVGLYCIGVVLMALGFILNAKSSLGITPICSIAYCVAYITGISFSDMTMILFVICFFVALLINHKKPHWTEFLQLPYCFIFTRCMSAFAAILPSPTDLGLRILFLVLAIICVGGGATLTLNMHIVPNPGDYMVNAVANKIKKPLGLSKNIIDLIVVALSVVTALIFGKNIIEAGIGVGTVATMFLSGRVIAIVNHFFVDKMRNLYKNAPIDWLDKNTVDVAR